MGRPQPLQQTMPGLWRMVRRFRSQRVRQRRLIGGSLPALFTEIVFRLLERRPLKFVFDRVILPPASQNHQVSLTPHFDRLLYIEGGRLG